MQVEGNQTGEEAYGTELTRKNGISSPIRKTVSKSRYLRKCGPPIIGHLRFEPYINVSFPDTVAWFPCTWRDSQVSCCAARAKMQSGEISSIKLIVANEIISRKGGYWAEWTRPMERRPPPPPFTFRFRAQKAGIISRFPLLQVDDSNECRNPSTPIRRLLLTEITRLRSSHPEHWRTMIMPGDYQRIIIRSTDPGKKGEHLSR
ncbi:hypothetical protein CEXT_629321 [Caerostris extrusa]|uniref:Uncharacterized protein n=1 Tax=Caerostris extrusa TaxID=172846 RepID=A0AAV4QN96_CAEEX|nr:hypothetical protein CEXT_629321 [Caerostris extrusa]